MENNRDNNPALNEMTAIVTGATRGIGAGICRILAGCGVKLTLGYLDKDPPAHDLSEELKSVFNADILLHKADISDSEGAKGIVRATKARFGRVDALVSNMGPFLYRPVSETTVKEWDTMISVNLSTHFYLVRELLPPMHEQGYGNFVFIGGVGSGQVTGHARASAYNAAKTGLAEFMRTLAIEEGPSNIRANMITPGIIDNGEYSDGFRQRILGDIPLGCIGQPEDIGYAVKWLLSAEARYVTGAIIDVSGGHHLTFR